MVECHSTTTLVDAHAKLSMGCALGLLPLPANNEEEVDGVPQEKKNKGCQIREQG